MYRNIVGAMYVINIVVQCIITLLVPAAIGFLIAYFSVREGAPTWLYAVLVPIGIISGFISMIKFAIGASEALERLEKQREDENKNEKE